MDKGMTRSELFAVWFVDHISTLTVTGAFMVIPLVARYFGEGVQSTVQYLSSSWAQLWFLPLIMLGQAVQGRMAEKRRSEIEQASQKRHEAREERAARHQNELLGHISAELGKLSQRCEEIKWLVGGGEDAGICED